MTKAKKTESKELVVLTPEEQEYINSITTAPKNTQTGPNRLIINTRAKDANGVKRPIGSWHITGTEVYVDGPVYFRPIRQANKLIKYEQDAEGNWVVDGESIYFSDYAEQLYDTKGTLALGRRFGKKYTQEEKDATKDNAAVYMDIFGLVRFDGDTNTYPVVYRVRGGKLKIMLDVFKAVPKDKVFSQYEYIMTTDQPAGKDYWDTEVSIDMSKVLPISDIIGYDKEIVAFIRASNAEVMARYNRNNPNIIQANVADAVIVEDDELPF